MSRHVCHLRRDIQLTACSLSHSLVCVWGPLHLHSNSNPQGFFFYLYNELAFIFLSEVGPVTSSVMNTAKRVIVIIACAIIFGEKMDRNAKLGAAVAVSGELHSLILKPDPQEPEP